MLEFHDIVRVSGVTKTFRVGKQDRSAAWARPPYSNSCSIRPYSPSGKAEGSAEPALLPRVFREPPLKAVFGPCTGGGTLEKEDPEFARRAHAFYPCAGPFFPAAIRAKMASNAAQSMGLVR